MRWSSDSESTLCTNTSNTMLGLMRCAVTIVAARREMASAWSSCASMTQTSAPHPLYVDSGFTASDDVSTCPGKSHTSNCTNDELAMSFLTILLVASMKSVSCGLILWNTTFWIDDLPARRPPINKMRGRACSSDMAGCDAKTLAAGAVLGDTNFVARHNAH